MPTPYNCWLFRDRPFRYFPLNPRREGYHGETSRASCRKKVRVDLQQPGFLIPEPDAPWIECTIIEVSDEGVCLEVGALAVPNIFGLAFTASGEVFRVCWLTWRNGERVGARFVSAAELRRGLQPDDAMQEHPGVYAG